MRRYREYWNDQTKWWRSRTLEWWATHLTAFYVAGAIMVMGAKFDDLILLKLNEIGDLAAGVFGPLAFLWLVLGYTQQGRELKLSSEALRMQAEELKASVQQQIALVEAQQDSLRNHEWSLEPLLRLTYKGSREYEGDYYEVFVIKNLGAYCEGVVLHFTVDGQAQHPRNLEPFYKETVQEILLHDMEECYRKYVIDIFYRKVGGRENSQKFELIKFESEGGCGVQVQKQAFSS